MQLTSKVTVHALIALVSAAFLVLGSSLSFARNESPSQPLLHYKEEGSFGTIKPNEVAKPAPTDMTPQRHARAVDRADYDSSSTTSASGYERPKYREIYEEMTKRQRSSYGDDEDLGITIGVGLGFKTFSSNTGVTFPFNRYAAWGLNAAYSNRDEKDFSSTRTSGEVDFILRLPNPSPFMPFVTVGTGYEAWRRAKDDGAGLEVFDQASSPTVNSSMGGSIRLARYVALVGALKSTTFTDNTPRVFTGDHQASESRTDERFDLGIALMF